MLQGALERFGPETLPADCAPEQVGPAVACSVERIASTEQRAEESPRPDSSAGHVPLHKLERRSRRMRAAVLERADRRAFRYDWQTPDHEHLSPAELAAIDAHRQRLLERVTHADGSRLAKLEGVHSPNDQRIARLIRDDHLFAETEWSKLQRHDRLYANAVLDASLGLRDDGTCERDWHSQRARSTFAIGWLFWRAGTTRIGDIGSLTVRGVSIDYLCAIVAPPGKTALHRNTLAGTHRARSSRNADTGYIVALENAGAFARFQYGDRRAEVRQVNEYTLRVSTKSEAQAALIERNEAAHREFLENRWRRLAAFDVLEVLSGQARARRCTRAAREREREAELCAIIRAELEPTGPP